MQLADNSTDGGDVRPLFSLRPSFQPVEGYTTSNIAAREGNGAVAGAYVTAAYRAGDAAVEVALSNGDVADRVHFKVSDGEHTARKASLGYRFDGVAACFGLRFYIVASAKGAPPNGAKGVYFKVESAQSGSAWTKVSITSASEGSVIVNYDEGRVRYDRWQSVEFEAHRARYFRVVFWGVSGELALAELFSSWVETRDLGFRKSYGDQQFRVPDFQAIRVLGNVVDEQGELRAVRVLRLCTLCGRL